MKKIILTILIFISLTIGLFLQKFLLNPYRGQAMAMPFITSFILSFYLILAYTVSFICYKFAKNIYWIYFTLACQLCLVIYTINKYIFYCALSNGDIPIDEWDSDYFPPISLNYFIIIFFSVLITGFCVANIRKTKNKNSV